MANIKIRIYIVLNIKYHQNYNIDNLFSPLQKMFNCISQIYKIKETVPKGVKRDTGKKDKSYRKKHIKFE